MVLLMLQRRCIEEDIKPRLKDPESIRITDRDFIDLSGKYSGSAVVEYTATNSFNARIRTRRKCVFLQGDVLDVAYNVNRDNKAAGLKERDFVYYNR